MGGGRTRTTANIKSGSDEEAIASDSEKLGEEGEERVGVRFHTDVQEWVHFDEIKY